MTVDDKPGYTPRWTWFVLQYLGAWMASASNLYHLDLFKHFGTDPLAAKSPQFW